MSEPIKVLYENLAFQLGRTEFQIADVQKTIDYLKKMLDQIETRHKELKEEKIRLEKLYEEIKSKYKELKEGKSGGANMEKFNFTEWMSHEFSEKIKNNDDDRRYMGLEASQVHNLSDIYVASFGYKTSGTFVEIGAYDGRKWSNTYPLSKLGWGGLYVEPNPALYAKCVANHADNKKVIVENCAIGNYIGKIKLYLGTSLSTTKEDMIDLYNRMPWSSGQLNKNNYIEADVFTMDYILEKSCIPKNFELLIIDVEGGEKEVLEGFNIQNWNPCLVIIETREGYDDGTELNKTDLKKDLSLIHNYFQNNGYDKICYDGVNTIFLRRDLYV